LGLVISRNFVRLMGGDIRVASRAGVGTTFSFDVTLRVASHVDRRTASRRVITHLAPGSPAWRVLVADDTAENRLLLVRLLTSIGFDVREATNGAEAVEAWQAWRPDLILMDMRMPVMDGMEAPRRIRDREAVADAVAGGRWPVAGSASEPNTATVPVESVSEPATGHGPRATKIIALTASAFEHDKDRFLEAGCDDFVPKPFRTATLLEKIGAHLGARYLYEEDETADTREEDEGLARDRVGLLPAEAVESLRTALTLGDVEAALEVIEGVRAIDGSLADDLSARVREYRFDEILDGLERAGAS
jgi:two-component system sensor histidine kinase/response regulator